MHRLSVVIPAYNEENTIAECINRVRAIEDEHLKIEIIVVDDASTDNTARIAQDLANQHGFMFIRHETNRGKGAALHTGFRHMTGDIVAVQDADLEYDPQDLKKLVGPIIDGRADVVLGSRFLSGSERRVQYFGHYVVNKGLTLICNFFTNLNLSDHATCYKVFRAEIIKNITLDEKRFGFDPEVIAKAARYKINGRRPRIYEMGISYSGRTYEEGKKIGIRDGFRALYVIFKYGLFVR